MISMNKVITILVNNLIAFNLRHLHPILILTTIQMSSKTVGTFKKVEILIELFTIWMMHASNGRIKGP